MATIFQKLTTHSKKALKTAFDFALSCGHKTVTPQHLLYGLSRQTGSIANQILTKVKIKEADIEASLTKNYALHQTVTQIGLASSTKKILEKSFLIASLNQHQYIGTEHLLASILAVKDDLTINFFQEKNLDLNDLQKQVDIILNSTSKFPDLTGELNYFEDKDFDYRPALHQTNLNQPSILDLFATNLTDATIQKKIDPVIGREEEINRLVQILSRRNKNNPLLLGDPGVGKTAIVEGLAKKILQAEVPEILAGKKIYTLDLSLVVAGTSFRGEFENRLKQIIAEIKKNPDLILFIDEIHNLIGVGSATGSMDAANILKPALARGEIRCIGATTLEDYKKYIESDPALERRFQPITINETSVQKTINILQGVRENYEIFHQVKINDEALAAAAELAERYITDRFLPDKAIDLIDEAAAAIRIKQSARPKILEIENLEKQLKATAQKKEESVAQEKFNLALKYRDQEKNFSGQLKELKNKYLQTKQRPLEEITKKEIAAVIAKMTGIPLNDLMMEEKNRLLGLEKILAQKIINQAEAIRSVAEFIRRSRTGIANANRPIGSFIFLGPSGVGKTELAKVLAETVFGSQRSLIRIDMSEFAESFNISKLIGAPAGYVGYREGAKLTDSVKRQPYSVVLFDEIEKAHPQVFSLLLQILEDGFLTDATGKKINFRNTIIIMTSNLGSNNFNRQAALGFQAQTDGQKPELEKNWQEVEQGVLKQLKEKFPPEFLSRVDKTVVFKPLDLKTMIKIGELQLAELAKRLTQQGLKIKIEPAVAKIIAKISYTPESGGRSIRQKIQELIESKIADKILTAKKAKTEKITVKVKNNQIIV